MINIIIQKIQSGGEIKDSMINITVDGKVLTMLIQSTLSVPELENIFKNISIGDWKFDNIKEGETAMNITESVVQMVREIEFKK
jgi:hypothetical protein